jgi:hypothetical protein
MWRAACALISCGYTILGGASSTDVISTNLNNINGLKFYHAIRGNLTPFAQKMSEVLTEIVSVVKTLKGHHEMHTTPPIPTMLATELRRVTFEITSNYSGG